MFLQRKSNENNGRVFVVWFVDLGSVSKFYLVNLIVNTSSFRK